MTEPNDYTVTVRKLVLAEVEQTIEVSCWPDGEEDCPFEEAMKVENEQEHPMSISEIYKEIPIGYESVRDDSGEAVEYRPTDAEINQAWKHIDDTVDKKFAPPMKIARYEWAIKNTLESIDGSEHLNHLQLLSKIRLVSDTLKMALHPTKIPLEST